MAQRSERPRRRGLIIVAAVALLLAIAGSSRFYTDVLWFKEVGLTSVLVRSLSTQFLVGLAAGVFTLGFIAANLWLTGRGGPVYATFRRADPFAAVRDQIHRFRVLLRLVIGGVIGFLVALGAAASWRTVLLYLNRVQFGVDDPQFNRDIGFYVFELPFFDLVLDLIWFIVIATIAVSLFAHFFYGAIDPARRLAGVRPSALAHISALLAALAIVKSVQYWLGTYQLNFSSRGTVTGASYTDVNAQLPALILLAIISLISAALFLVNIRYRTIILPLAAVGIWILTAFLAGFVWPTFVQQFSVKPQELQRESPYIQRNLDATRAAFGLGEVRSRPFAAESDFSGEEVAENRDVLRNVRLWDPELLAAGYEQLQAIRPFYTFPDVDIDRYEIDGEIRQVLLSAREISLDNLPPSARGWQNRHLQYTHGFGLVASLANSVTGTGQPDFLVSGVPGVVEEGAETLATEQARLYFGEGFEADDYSIVPSEQEEVDYQSEVGLARTSYGGRGGVPLGNFFTRLSFAIREGDPNIMLSGLITDRSRALIYRDIRDRVHRAAPFLSYDSDPYVAVVDDRLVWIIDAYTSTPFYPYSQRFPARDAVVSTELEGVMSGNVNYVRNSVKVVVDAYDGSMNFYIVDDSDPLIAAWRKAFPSLFTDDEPSDELREHFRYPEDLFNLQTQVYRTYHVEGAEEFFAGGEAWELPQDPATYLLTRLPGEESEEFLITRAATPRGKQNMVAFMVGRSDPDRYGEFETLLFPRQTRIDGPDQVHGFINQDVEVSQTRTLLERSGSTVDFGRLIVLPIGDSILYVQPFFVSAENVRIPELKRVAVVLGGRVTFEDTFDEALASLLGVEVGEPDEPPVEEPGPGEEPGPDEPPVSADERLLRLIARADALYNRAQEALAAGDFETYGRLIEELGRVIERARQLGGPAPTG